MALQYFLAPYKMIFDNDLESWRHRRIEAPGEAFPVKEPFLRQEGPICHDNGYPLLEGTYILTVVRDGKLGKTFAVEQMKHGVMFAANIRELRLLAPALQNDFNGRAVTENALKSFVSFVSGCSEDPGALSALELAAFA